MGSSSYVPVGKLIGHGTSWLHTLVRSVCFLNHLGSAALSDKLSRSHIMEKKVGKGRGGEGEPTIHIILKSQNQLPTLHVLLKYPNCKVCSTENISPTLELGTGTHYQALSEDLKTSSRSIAKG